MLGGSDPAAVIGAVGAALGAVLGGVAAVLAALAKREGRRVRRELDTHNGRTIAEEVQRLTADVAELGYRVAMIERTVSETGE